MPELEKALISACEQVLGSTKVTELLEAGADPNSDDARDEHGATVLHYACRLGWDDITSLLLDTCKCDPEVRDKDDRTPLHYACWYGNVNVILPMLNSVPANFSLRLTQEVSTGSQLNLNVVDKYGNTPLHKACEAGREATTSYLLSLRMCDLNCKNNEGLTPLQVATKAFSQTSRPVTTLVMSYIDIICLLVESRADFSSVDLNVVDNDGNSLLHKACQNGRSDKSRCLLETEKCDRNSKNKAGLTPLHVTSPWCTAVIEQLIKHGANLNVQDSDGNTPLHKACQAGAWDSVRCLAKAANCSSNCTNTAGLTPLQLHVISAHTDSTLELNSKIILELIKHGANPNEHLLDDDNDTPLHVACRHERLDIIQLVLTHSGHVDPTNNAGLTPLQVTPLRNTDIIGELLQHGANPNVIDSAGNTPLHKMCERGILTGIICLLQASYSNCDPNIKNKAGLTPLQMTSPQFTSVIQELIKHGANADIADIDGDTPLHYACRSGSRETVLCLLKAASGLVQHKNKAGLTPLQVTHLMNTDTIRKLLQYGASTNVVDGEGNTPLHNACRSGREEKVFCLLLAAAADCDLNCKNRAGLTPLQVTPPDYTAVIKQLVQHGANLNVKDSDGNTPLHKACQAGNLDSVMCLARAANCDSSCTNKAGLTPVQLVSLENTVIIWELIKDGANPNVHLLGDDNDTPLHLACRHKRLDIVQHILNHPNHVDVTNKAGLTPLQVTPLKNTAIVGELLQYGANPNVVDGTGNTPLHKMCQDGRQKGTHCLLQAIYCDPNIKNKAGLTPLQVTSPHFTSVIRELIEHGAGANVTDEYGNTPLHCACQSGREETVVCLLNAASGLVQHKNKAGLTPLQMTDMKYAGIVKALVQNGANPNVLIDEHVNTPLHKACFERRMDTVRCLLEAENCAVDCKNNLGLTPLQMLFKNLWGFKDLSLLEELIQHGADQNVVDDDGSTPLDIACFHGNTGVVKCLLKSETCLRNPKDKFGLTPLLKALKIHRDSCKPVLIKELCEHGVDPNVVDKSGNTPLHLASVFGLLEIATCLLEVAKCDPNSKNKVGLTPLQMTSDCDLTTVLTKHGANPNVADSGCNTPLHKACSTGNLNVALVLLNTEKCDPDPVNNEGLTPLQVTRRHRTDLIQQLIQRGANPNVVDKNGDTPLHKACRNGNLQNTKLYLALSHCDPNIKNKEGLTPLQVTPPNCTHIIDELLQCTRVPTSDCKGDTPLHAACSSGNLDMVQHLMRRFDHDPNSTNKAGVTPLQTTPLKYTPIISVLIKHGANPNVVDNDGDTLLHKACFEENVDVVVCLLNSTKCDPNIKNRFGLTPLQVTASWNTSIVKELIRLDANPNVVDKNGETPLHKACRDGNLDSARSILEAPNCDPNIPNKANQTPIQVTQAWNKEILRALIRHGANVNVVDSDGNTPLHKVCHAGILESATCFLEAPSCDPNLRNKLGLTPLQVTYPKDTNIIRKLIEHGANLTILNNFVNTPLHNACFYGNLDTVQLLLDTEQCDLNAKNEDGLTPLLVTSPEHTGVVRALIRSGANPKVVGHNGATLLHKACRNRTLATVRYILSLPNCDPNTKNGSGLSPLQVTPPECNDVIRELIKHGANPTDVYKTHGKPLKSPLQSPVKVFVVGNSSVGKSTLTAALQRESTFFGRLFLPPRKVSGVDQKTAGVIPYEFESKEYGYTTLYDFAGQREFYGSHAALLENSIQASPPIFLLVIDLSKDEEDIYQNIHYWFTFLENQCTTLSSKPHIVIIGSHADVVSARGEDPVMKANDIKLRISPSGFVFVRFITMDCQYTESSGMSELRQCLRASCNALRTAPTITFNSHCFYVYLVDQFKDTPAVTVRELQAKMSQQSLANDPNSLLSFIPTNVHALCKVCNELNDRGHVLFLKDPENIESSWIIIDKAVLLSDVTGTIFAPESFKQYSILTQCRCSTGVVPLSSIATRFHNHNPTMLVGFLSCLEFCHEISDEEILLLITKEHQQCVVNRPSQHERYFLFPALVSMSVPDTVWEPNESQFTYNCGWILQCSSASPEQFFSSRFLQVLLLRLAFSFPLSHNEEDGIPAFQRICSIWKNGLFWGNKHGVETLVEVITGNKAVVLLMRCNEESLDILLQIRSQIILKILGASNEFCGTLVTVESFIEPSKTVEYPLRPLSQLKLFSLTSISRAAIEAKPSAVLCSTGTIPFENLVLFEPYAGLGGNVLHELFRYEHEQASKSVPEDLLLLSIAKKSTTKPELILKMFNFTAQELPSAVATTQGIFSMLKAWRDRCDGTYQKLRERLDQFSIFAGRSSFLLAGVSDKQTKTSPEATESNLFEEKSKPSGDPLDEGSSSPSTASAAPLTRSDVPELKDLVVVLKGVDWHSLGLQLDISSTHLNQIDDQYPQKQIDRKRCAMFEQWLANEPDPSWKKIVTALERVGGHNGIIRTIQREFIENST